MKKILMTAAALCCMTMLVMTSCSTDDTPVVVTDDKPFPFDSEIDNSVRPGDDFYKYVLGQWLKSSNPSPSFAKQVEEEYKVLLDNTLATNTDPLLVMLRSKAETDMSDDSKNKALINERLQMLEQVTTATQLYEAFGVLQKLGYCPLFRLTPVPGVGRKVINIFGTGNTTEEMAKALKYKKQDELDSLVNVYCQHLKGFGFTDERIAEIVQNAILVETLEMSAYNSATDRVQYPLVNSHRALDVDDEQQLVNVILEMIGFSMDDMTAGSVSFYEPNILAVLQLFTGARDNEQDLKAFRDYMIYNVIAQDAPFVPSVNNQTNSIAMLRRALQNNKYYKYRLLVESYGSDNIYKQQCNDIMERMRKLFIQRVNDLDWMSDATKAEARHKAEAMKFYIGYPEKWNDNMSPTVDGDCMMAIATQLRQNAVKIYQEMRGLSVDEIEWDFFASYAQFTTDNATYMSTLNSLLILPAWITLPRFNNDQSEAALYATAVTFGHELCHGFDASGSTFDAEGNRSNWWQPADEAAFQAKQQIMVDLFNQLEAYPGQAADGTKTLIENMADYGGINLALGCYKQRLEEQGFVGAQLDEQIKKFFIAYAYTWKYEAELDVNELIRLHNIDTHSLPHNRINGMMRLQDDWYRLFDVKPTDKLYLAPEDRVKIW